MKIKKSSLDTLLILFLMFVTILPLFIAKQFVILSLFFLVVRIVISADIFFYLKKKMIIFTLLMPGILGAFFLAPEHLVRFSSLASLRSGFILFTLALLAHKLLPHARALAGATLDIA